VKSEVINKEDKAVVSSRLGNQNLSLRIDTVVKVFKKVREIFFLLRIMIGLSLKNGATTRNRSSSLGCIRFVLILQVLSFVVPRHHLFARAKKQNQRVMRGSEFNVTSLDGIYRLELPETSSKPEKKKNLLLQKGNAKGSPPATTKDDKRDGSRIRVNKTDKKNVTPTLPGNASTEKHSGRDDIDPPFKASSDSLLSISNTVDLKANEAPALPDNATTENHSGRDDIDPPFIASSDSLLSISNTVDLKAELPPTVSPSSIETKQPNSKPTAGTIETPIVEKNSSSLSTGSFLREDDFNKTKIVKLRPIIFNITADMFTRKINTTKLKRSFRSFIEVILDMNSNGNWYPFHSKLVSNMTIEALSNTEAPINEENDEQHADPNMRMSFQLIINGLITVREKKQYDEIVAFSKRTTDGTEKRMASNYEAESESNFYDFFDHSMLLHLTFWGTSSIQEALEGIDVKNPIITSVTVGEKEVIYFGIDKDDNYLYNGNHQLVKSKHLTESATTGRISGSAKLSSPLRSKSGLLSIIMMSVGMIFSIERLL